MKKTLQELTIMDGFLFGEVMQDPENCRILLERILGREIRKVEVITEKAMKYHPDYHGIRMDVYARDVEGSRFNVEMQVRKTPIEKRSRYYHSFLDMSMLPVSTEFDQLPDSYVIFICDYDPFGQSSYRYRIESRCLEFPDLEIPDGRHTIILYNKGSNREEIPEELVRFLEYTRKPVEESEYDSSDDYIDHLQESIRRIKSNREMEGRFMTYWALQAAFMDERREGREEGMREGRILQTISIYREELHLDDNEIQDRIQSRFQLSEEEAGRYIVESKLDR